MIRVLYAEDDRQLAEMVQLYFARTANDCTLDVVDSGRRCLEAMASGGWDVLLLDLKLPDLDGLEVLGELDARQDPTPVIMVSGQGQHELAVRALRAGAVDCIDKSSPDFRRIIEIVRRVHARRTRTSSSSSRPPNPAREHHVVMVDAIEVERRSAAEFFAAHAPRLRFTATSPDAVDRLVSGATPADAIVLGPNLGTDAMLDTLRRLHAADERRPVLVVGSFEQAETTIAAFRLGAHDYLLKGPACLTDLVFSLHHALKRADAERLNARLTDELADLNHSLAAQVAARTRELEQEVIVRRQAEKRAEENAAWLQSLSSRLLRVQEDERRALAQELHDQIGQLLTGLRFELEAAREAAASQPLGEALVTTGELLRSVRELTLQLRPRMLDDLGLRPALEWQAKLFQHQTGIQVELELSLPDQRFASELETTVFRMVQEALTNVARHSGAKAAVVTVTADDDALQVEIADRGRGFDAPAALARRDSLGLAGLAERVRLAGGQLEVVSIRDQGTRLHAEFPLRILEPALS